MDIEGRQTEKRQDTDRVLSELIHEMDDIAQLSLPVFEGLSLIGDDESSIEYPLGESAALSLSDEGKRIIVLRGKSNPDEIIDQLGSGKFTFFVDKDEGFRPVWIESYLDAASFSLMREILACNKENMFLASRFSTLFSFGYDLKGKPAFDKVLPAVPIRPGNPVPPGSPAVTLLDKMGKPYQQYWKEEISGRLDLSDIELIGTRIAQIRSLIEQPTLPDIKS